MPIPAVRIIRPKEKRNFEMEWNDLYASPYARGERGLPRPGVTTSGIQQDA